MSLSLIEQQLQRYNVKDSQEELNALKEICQEIALAALSKTDFFSKAAFQGGTCLRIFYQLPRFSEDLDFIALEALANFTWKLYLDAIAQEFQNFGLSVSVLDRSESQGAIRSAFLKEDSIGKVLTLSHLKNTMDRRKITIKLEIDTAPPVGSISEFQYLSFPFFSKVRLQNESSLFAGKLHALLARRYAKGRDWWDCLWYIQRGSQINYDFLENALRQQGPYKGQVLTLNSDSLRDLLVHKIQSLSISELQEDLRRFLPLSQWELVESWTQDLLQFFLTRLPDSESHQS